MIQQTEGSWIIWLRLQTARWWNGTRHTRRRYTPISTMTAPVSASHTIHSSGCLATSGPCSIRRCISLWSSKLVLCLLVVWIAQSGLAIMVNRTVCFHLHRPWPASTASTIESPNFYVIKSVTLYFNQSLPYLLVPFPTRKSFCWSSLLARCSKVSFVFMSVESCFL